MILFVWLLTIRRLLHRYCSIPGMASPLVLFLRQCGAGVDSSGHASRASTPQFLPHWEWEGPDIVPGPSVLDRPGSGDVEGTESGLLCVPGCADAACKLGAVLDRLAWDGMGRHGTHLVV